MNSQDTRDDSKTKDRSPNRRNILLGRTTLASPAFPMNGQPRHSARVGMSVGRRG
jgi:hypothetical protein